LIWSKKSWEVCIFWETNIPTPHISEGGKSQSGSKFKYKEQPGGENNAGWIIQLETLGRILDMTIKSTKSISLPDSSVWHATSTLYGGSGVSNSWTD